MAAIEPAADAGQSVPPYSETSGPRVGVSLSRAQAQKLLDYHLPGLRCTSLRYVDRGYNNRTYVLGVSDGPEIVVRLCGRFWTRRKTENEVACLIYVGHHCPGVPVPKVLFRGSDRTLIGAEYIGLEMLPGRPMDEAWPGMPEADRLKAVGQLAEHLAKVRQLKFDRIGNLGFRTECTNGSALPEVSDIFVDECFELSKGPFESYRDFAQAQFDDSLGHFLRHPLFRPLHRFEARLRKFREYLASECRVDLWGAIVGESAAVMTHYDFEPRNVLVSGEGDVTGILDWEFAGAFPEDAEWFVSFEFLGGNTAEVVTEELVRNTSDAGTLGIGEQKLEELGRYRDHFEGKLAALGALVPPRARRDVHLARADVWVLQENIAPWYLRDMGEVDPDGACAQREEAVAIVDAILRKYGV